MNKRVLVLGLGNVLLTDDGIGVFAVEKLKSSYEFSEEVDVVDGGTLGLDLLVLIEGRQRVLIIDAVDFGKKPGSIAVLEDEEIPRLLSTGLSVHTIGLADVLSALMLSGQMPLKMSLIGIQPETLEPGMGISESLSLHREELLGTIVNKLHEWGLKCTLIPPSFLSNCRNSLCAKLLGLVK